MKTIFSIMATLILIMIIVLSGRPVLAQGDPLCDGIWLYGVCTTTTVTSGQNTTRTEGYTVEVAHHEEEWGKLSDVMLAGYWRPQEGQRGVRFDEDMTCMRPFEVNGKTYCHEDDFTCSMTCDLNGTVQGYVVVFINGQWEYDHNFEGDTSIDDICSAMGGQWGDSDGDGEMECLSVVPPYEKLSAKVYKQAYVSSTACEYKKSDGIRWYDSWDEYNYTPFEDIIIDEWLNIEVISHFWGASLQLPFPCPGVIREPYPRAIVGEEAYFTVIPETVSASTEVVDICTPDITNYELHARLVPVQEIDPVWFWDERSFSNNPTISEGWTVSHVWDTASISLDGDCDDLTCDKPLWGPSLIGEWLPSYKVNVTMAYALETRRTWTDWYGNTHDTGWEMINLQDYGYDTSLVVLTGARDVTTPQPGAMPPKDISECIVPVPVLESQSILSGD